MSVRAIDARAPACLWQHVTADTRDHEDHTFCGVMFDVACVTALPAEYIEIETISVRGDLGPMTVWRTEAGVDTGGEVREDFFPIG